MMLAICLFAAGAVLAQDERQLAEMVTFKKDGETAFKLEKGVQVGTIEKMAEEYTIGFTIKPGQSTVDQWANIVHFTATGNNCCNPGDRVPGIWFYGNTRRLHVINGVHTNDECPIEEQLKPGVEVKFKMVHYSTRVEVFLDDRLVCTEPHASRNSFENVEVWASDEMYKTADATLMDFYYTPSVPAQEAYRYLTPKGEERELKKNTNLGLIVAPYEYEIGFDIKPDAEETVNAWANIVHFTTGGDCCKAGDRVPGIWFYANSRKLHVINGPHKNDECPIADELEAGKWSTIRLIHKLTTVEVHINGKLACTEDHVARMAFGNVGVWASNPWYEPAKAMLRGLWFRNTVDDSKLCLDNNGGVPSPGNESEESDDESDDESESEEPVAPTGFCGIKNAMAKFKGGKKTKAKKIKDACGCLEACDGAGAYVFEEKKKTCTCYTNSKFTKMSAKEGMTTYMLSA